jgi:hypothetical protein
VEHAGHGVARDGAGRGLPPAARGHARALGLADADHQDAARAEMDRGRQRRELAHGAVTEVFLVPFHPERHGGKEEGDGAGGHQVFDGDGLEFRAPPGAVPGLHRVVGAGLAEGPVFARGVARCRDAQGMDQPLLQRALQALQVDRVVQRVHQRQRVEQRAVAAHLARQREPGDHPVGAHPAGRFEPVDALRAQAAPEGGQLRQGRHALGGDAAQVGGIERARRGAEQPLERKRVGRRGALRRPGREHRAHRLEHAHLIGGARAPAHEHQRTRVGAVFGSDRQQRVVGDQRVERQNEVLVGARRVAAQNHDTSPFIFFRPTVA